MRRLALAVLLGFAAPAFARIVDLSSLPEDLRGRLLVDDPKLVGRDLSPGEIDALLKRLAVLPNVQGAVATEQGERSVRIEARLQRQVGSVAFQGLQALSDSAARAAFGLEKGAPYDMEALIEAAERLRTAYRTIGVRNPVLDVETPEVSPGRVDLLVKVTEGPITQVRSWTVLSPNEALNNELDRRLESDYDGAYTEELVQAALDSIRASLRKGHYLRADVTSPEVRLSADESSADLIVRIERPESYAVDFRGNRELTTGALENNILDLRNFATANPNVVSELTDKIRLAYLTRGYARVEVRAEENEGARPFQRRLVFDINEGPRVRIDEFDITGRMSRPADYYADFLSEHSSELVEDGFYNKDDLEAGYRNLVLELQNQGFLVAKIVSTRTQYNRDRTKITVHVNLDEGPLTLVAGVAFEGNAHVPSDELTKLLDLEVGGPLRLSEVERAPQLIRDYYQDRGYIEMQVLNEKKDDLVTYSDDNTRARLLFRIDEGPQVRVNSIVVDGNAFTKDYVIRNELDFEVGDLLTPTRIHESISRLQRSGHFASVEIKTLEENTSVEDRTVIVRVTERNPGTFTIGAGATNENQFTLRGYTGVAYRNLFGTGRGVSLRLEGNYITALPFIEQKITFGYLEPFLFFTRNRGRINVTRQKTIENFELGKISELNQATYSVERDFTSHITGIWDVYSIGTYNDTYLDDSREAKLDIALTGLRFDIDYRDNPFNPTKGHLTKIAADYSSPKIGSMNTDEFYRSTASYTFYLGVPNSNVIWANLVRGGWLKSGSAGLDGGVPYEKVGFVLGGRSTLRGFEAGTSEVFPNADDLGTDLYRLTTTAYMGLIKSEVRFPLWGESLGGAVFYDGGTVQIQGLEFQDKYRDSAGIGIRYNTPVGPLNLEFGWKLNRRPGEDPGRFHLSVGAF